MGLIPFLVPWGIRFSSSHIYQCTILYNFWWCLIWPALFRSGGTAPNQEYAPDRKKKNFATDPRCILVVLVSNPHVRAAHTRRRVCWIDINNAYTNHKSSYSLGILVGRLSGENPYKMTNVVLTQDRSFPFIRCHHAYRSIFINKYGRVSLIN